MTQHPHAEATYEVTAMVDGNYQVDVAIPGSNPTKISGFDSAEKAEAWVERHKANVATGSLSGQSRNWSRGFGPR